jgi:hypothetical protein
MLFTESFKRSHSSFVSADPVFSLARRPFLLGGFFASGFGLWRFSFVSVRHESTVSFFRP